MNLCGTRAYLCGAMDRVDDGGTEWRDALTPFLEDMGVVVLNPCKKPINLGYEDAEVRKKIDVAKQLGCWNVLNEYRDIRTVDLRMVDLSDFLVVNIDMDVHACGTYEELFLANRQKKPVIIHCNQGKENLPNWLFFTLPSYMFFSDWEAVKEYLNNINNASKEMAAANRWTIFDLAAPTLKSLLKYAEHDEELKEIIRKWYWESDAMVQKAPVV